MLVEVEAEVAAEAVVARQVLLRDPHTALQLRKCLIRCGIHRLTSPLVVLNLILDDHWR